MRKMRINKILCRYRAPNNIYSPQIWAELMELFMELSLDFGNQNKS